LPSLSEEEEDLFGSLGVEGKAEGEKRERSQMRREGSERWRSREVARY
jgi:hypothetical protein